MDKQALVMRSAAMLLALMLLAVIVMPVAAVVKPTMTVFPSWRPGEQLDSDPGAEGGANRYVDIDIFVQGNVQFWAADVSCTVSSAVLQEYTVTPGGDPGDDVDNVRWGPDWGIVGTDFTQVPNIGRATHTVSSANLIVDFAASRLGSSSPIGLNGVTYTSLLATLRLQVKQLVANATSTLKCNVSLLDRDGRSVSKVSTKNPPPLRVLTGYVISGKAQYQTGGSSPGITVSCENGSPPALAGTTSFSGVFTIGNIRSFGNYECTFFGNKTTTGSPQDDDVFLRGTTQFDLNTTSYQLLPVILLGGNVDRDGSAWDATPPGITRGTEVIDLTFDVTAVTSNWDGIPGAFGTGDSSGDGKVNEVDLAIVAGNYNRGEATQTYDHLVYGLARDYDGPFPNSRTWFGGRYTGAVSALVKDAKKPDFWPSVSPNGTMVAFSRLDTKAGRYQLFTMPLNNVPNGKNTLITPKSTNKAPYLLDAFAPSWSPDSTRIAFACAGDGGEVQFDGWVVNDTNICVVDADGRNLHTIATGAKIFPPAWFDNNVLIYAGQDANISDNFGTANTVCPDTLCYYDFARGMSGKVSTILDFGATDIVDMPVIRTNSGTTFLFYRFYDSGATRHKIRAGTLTYNGTSFGGGITGSVGSSTHKDVQTTGGGDISETPATMANVDVDFYNVSPQLDVIFYGTVNEAFYRNFNTAGGIDNAWSTTTESFFVDGHVGNPSGIGAGNNLTDRHALRSTVEWVP